jgi:hypothetical protein
MLDAYQVEVIAAMTDGGMVHATPACMGEEVWEEIQAKTDAADGFIPDYRRFWDIAATDFGFSPMIRYNLDSEQSERAYEIRHDPESYSSDLEVLINKLDNLEALGEDTRDLEQKVEDMLEDLVREYCETCSEVID